MPKAWFIPALCLTLMAAFALPQAMADDFAVARPPQWAQPVDAQYNLYQMSPTLYRSALPDDQAQPLLEKLHIGTVINFLPEADSSWLKTPGVEQIQLPYRTNHVDDADVLAALRAENSHFKDGEKYMMQANIPKLRQALASGACSTSPFASCVVKNWLSPKV